MSSVAVPAVLPVLGVILAAAALVTALAIQLSMPLLRRYAMARPNARSSHREPTPQGGGGPVVAVALGALTVTTLAGLTEPQAFHLLLAAAGVLIALVGAADDIRPLPAVLRLALQALLVGMVVFSAPENWRLAPVLPPSLERLIAVVAGVWFVNLTNFMDGIDGITVAEMVPVSVALAGLAVLGGMSLSGGVLAAALAGALLGFFIFNRPPAKVFLGDVGSLPIGLIIAALLFEAACRTSLVPALIVPMYYLVDATGTLLVRLRAGENVLVAHRRHAYQNAVDGGWSAGRVARRVLWLNLLLIVLAWVALAGGPAIQITALAAAFVAALLVCRTFRAQAR